MGFFCKRKVSKSKRKKLDAKGVNTIKKYSGMDTGNGVALVKPIL